MYTILKIKENTFDEEGTPQELFIYVVYDKMKNASVAKFLTRDDAVRHILSLR